MKTRSIVWLAGGALVLGGCGSDGDEPSGSADPSSTTSTTATATGSTVLTGKGSRPAGTYRITETDPDFELTIEGDDWWAGEAQKELVAFNLYPSDWTAYVTVAFPDSVYDDEDTNADPLPEDMVHWLRHRPGLTVGPAIETEIGGCPAVRFDAQLTNGIHRCDDGEGGQAGCLLLAPIPANEDVRIYEDERFRFWVVHLDSPVIISVSQVEERFDEFVDRGTAVVESIDFLDDRG